MMAGSPTRTSGPPAATANEVAGHGVAVRQCRRWSGLLGEPLARWDQARTRGERRSHVAPLAGQRDLVVRFALMGTWMREPTWRRHMSYLLPMAIIAVVGLVVLLAGDVHAS